MFTIKTEIKGEVYYLFSGWTRSKTVWVKPEEFLDRMCFKSSSGAKKSLNKLLKDMPEYIGNIFEVIEFSK